MPKGINKGWNKGAKSNTSGRQSGGQSGGKARGNNASGRERNLAHPKAEEHSKRPKR